MVPRSRINLSIARAILLAVSASRECEGFQYPEIGEKRLIESNVGSVSLDPAEAKAVSIHIHINQTAVL